MSACKVCEQIAQTLGIRLLGEEEWELREERNEWKNLAVRRAARIRELEAEVEQLRRELTKTSGM